MVNRGNTVIMGKPGWFASVYKSFEEKFQKDFKHYVGPGLRWNDDRFVTPIS